jgi:hypothetical protein
MLLPLLLPPLLVAKPESCLMEDSRLDSIAVLSFLTMVLVLSDLTEEEDLEEVSDSVKDSEEDLEADSEDSEETHTDGLRLVTTPNTPLLTHLMTLSSTL